MKLGIFTDSHYSSQEVTCGNRYNSRSLQKIKQAFDIFKSEKCEKVICLGDLIDKENDHAKEIANLTSISKIVRDSGLPFICVMGNHDAFAFETDEFYRILGVCPPQIISADNKTLIFLDACHYRNGKHYTTGEGDWTNTFYPYTDTLRDTLSSVKGDIYIFIHQNLDPNAEKHHLLHNADEINKILSDSGKVKAVYQGHYHPGVKSEHGGIQYVTFPAMCETDGGYFIVEI